MRLVDGFACRRAQHHHGAARRAAPPFLRRADQHIYASGLHIYPQCPRGDAVQYQQTLNGVHGISQGAQITVGQDHARSGFHMGGEHQGRPLVGDGGHGFFNGDWCPRGLSTDVIMGIDAAGLEHGVRTGNLAHVKDLRPAVAEPAVADDQDMLVAGKLPGNRLHAEGAAARHQHGRMRAIDGFEHG